VKEEKNGETYRVLLHALRVQTGAANRYRRRAECATRLAQLYGLAVIEYIADLLTASPKERFSRDELLVTLNGVKNDPDIFPADVVATHDRISEYVDTVVRNTP